MPVKPVETKRIEQVMKLHPMGGFRFPRQLPQELEQIGAHVYHLTIHDLPSERRKFEYGSPKERKDTAVHMDSVKGVRDYFIQEELKEAEITKDRRTYKKEGRYADRRAPFENWLKVAKSNPKFNALVKKFTPKSGSNLFKTHSPKHEKIIADYVNDKKLSRKNLNWVEEQADMNFPSNLKKVEQKEHVRKFLLEVQKLALKKRNKEVK
ncbi:hypothetical protein HY989_06585 [Candidatus Micrarchaeota archaeon]|nr:hypothetical protein [Candidatus Micrarchaeota archaeon]